MRNISIIARRLKDGHVQYGGSGGDGVAFIAKGGRLKKWYNTEEMAEYLFSYGQLISLGTPQGEEDEYSCRCIDTITSTEIPHYLGTTELQIFDHSSLADYAFFYDTDGIWYYICSEHFHIKMPLELMLHHLDEEGYEHTYRKWVEREIIEYIFGKYYAEDSDFRDYVSDYRMDNIRRKLLDDEEPMYLLFNKYQAIVDYFDNWILVCTDADCNCIIKFIVKPKSEQHIETIEWING